MKKIFLFVAMFLLASCIFDAKDSCLDNGGSYNEITKKCEKNSQSDANSDAQNNIMPENSENSENMENTLLPESYPINLKESVAAKFCEQKGGKIAIETENEVEVLYCEINNSKEDAWQFLKNNQ